MAGEAKSRFPVRKSQTVINRRQLLRFVYSQWSKTSGVSSEDIMLNLDVSVPERGVPDGAIPDAQDLPVLGVRQRARLYEISRAFSELVDLDRLLPVVIAETKALFAVESSAIM